MSKAVLTDLPVGRQDLLVLLKKLIKYIQIKVEIRKTQLCLNMDISTRGFHIFNLHFILSAFTLVCFWIFLR